MALVFGLRAFGVLMLARRDYLELVDHTSRQIHPGQRGAMTGPLPASLVQIGCTADQWQRQILAIGADYFRAIGASAVLIEKVQEIEQTWLRGIGIARQLKR